MSAGGHPEPRTVERGGADVVPAELPGERWHAEPVDEVERGLASNAVKGLALVTLAAFSVGMSWYGTEEGLARAGTLAFMTPAFAQVFHAFNVRSRTGSIASSQLFSNVWLWAAVLLCLALQLAAVYLPLLQVVLHTVPLGWQEWLLVLGLSLLPLVVVELVKLMRRVWSKITGRLRGFEL